MSRRPDPFRSRPNGATYGNGYSNGYGASNNDDDYDPYNSNSYTSSNPYSDTGFSSRRLDPPRPPQSSQPPVNPATRRADRRAGRAGGYGGFAFEPEDDEPPPPQEEPQRTGLERMGAKRRSGGSPRAFAGRRGNAGYGRDFGYGEGGRQMEGQSLSDLAILLLSVAAPVAPSTLQWSL